MAEDVRFSETILGNIVKDATINWDYEHETMEEKEAAAQEKLEAISNLPTVEDRVAEARNTVGPSVDLSIKGIAEVAGLTDTEMKQLENDVNTRGTISDDLAQKVRTALGEQGKDKSIVEILSIIHDGWVTVSKINSETGAVEYTNGNKFEDPKRMGKLYQFVDLKLLDFGEAKLDLLFLRPILEANGIELDEVALQHEFLHEQKAFLEANGIKDTVDLKEKLGQGAAFYPPLEGVTTSKGKTAEPELITDRLQDSLIIEKMTEQVAQRAQVPERTKESVSIEQIEEVAETLPKSKVSETTKDIRNSEEPTKDDKAVEEQGE